MRGSAASAFRLFMTDSSCDAAPTHPIRRSACIPLEDANDLKTPSNLLTFDLPDTLASAQPGGSLALSMFTTALCLTMHGP